MKLFQIFGGIACLGLWAVLAVANIDALTSLGSETSYITVASVELTTKQALGSLAIVVDILLIASGMAAGYWWSRGNEATAFLATIVWIICAGVSWHSTKVWIETNVAKVSAPAIQSQDVYATLKDDIELTQKKLDWLLATNQKNFNRAERATHRETIAKTEARIDDLRSRLKYSEVKVASHPIEGFEVYIATGLLALNALAWISIFGFGTSGRGPGYLINDTAQPHAVTPEIRTVYLPTPDTAQNGAQAGVMTPQMTPPHDTAPHPEKPNDFIGVTVSDLRQEPASSQDANPLSRPASKPVSSRTSKQAKKASKPKPNSRPEPPPSSSRPKLETPPKPTNVVAINTAATDAIKGWVDDNTSERTGSFLSSAEAWAAYEATGPVSVRKDDFCKVMKDTIGAGNYTRKGGVRGYAGINLVEDREWRRAV